MTVRYAPSYIDEVLARGDDATLYTILTVLSRRHELPLQCRLFILTYEWIGVDWQYYESLSETHYQEFAELLIRFKLFEILSKLNEARKAWNSGDDEIAGVDRWAQGRQAEIVKSLWELVMPISDIIKQKGA